MTADLRDRVRREVAEGYAPAFCARLPLPRADLKRASFYRFEYPR